jgi:hypothetical protein
MLHRTVYVLVMSMLFGALLALGLSADSLSHPQQVTKALPDMPSRTPASSPIHPISQSAKPDTQKTVVLTVDVLQSIHPDR